MTNETKQTAVEILCNKLAMKIGVTFYIDHQKEMREAKEMEKEQIENAYQAGQDNVDYTASFVDENGLENYYNETYGGNK
jgi:Tfp pilus assembly protein PilO